jgi:polyhydroxybutyrate depolymerase
MSSLRLALGLVALMGCARGALVDDDVDPTDAEPGEMPPDGELDGSLRDDGDASASRDGGPRSDAGARDASKPNLSLGDASTLDAGARDAGQAAGMLTTKSVDVGGTMRTYLLYVPTGLDKSAQVPLVSVHHPSGQAGQYMADITTWRQIADREKFVVVFPNGGSGLQPWNVGTGACNWGSVAAAPTTQDDFGFVRAMVTDVPKVQAIDSTRVFVAGLNLGGYFANHIGCQARDVVRAVAAHSAGTYAGSCPGNPVPVMLIHGDADNLIPLQCAREALSYWVERNGCSAETTSEPIKLGECQWNTGCPAGREIGLCTLNGMGHGWAGAPVTGNWLQLQYGGGEQFENAAELIWKFFKKHL